MIVARAPGADPRPETLRAHLKKQLPAYMIPARYLVLDALPTTTSGKLDRQSLGRGARQAVPVVQAQEGGLDPIEAAVAARFAELLAVDALGPEDDFFALGGDSLRATLLHAQLEKEFQVALTLEELLHDPTVRGIAALVRPAEMFVASKPGRPGAAAPGRRVGPRAPRALAPVLVPLREAGSRPPLFIVHGAKGLAFVSPHLLSVLEPDQPVYSLQACGLDRNQGEHRSIPRMADAYIAAIRRIRPRGPYLIGSLCVGYVLAVEMARRLRDLGEPVAPLLLIDPPHGALNSRSLKTRIKLSIKRRLKRRFGRHVDSRYAKTVRLRAAQGRIRLDVDDRAAIRDAWLRMLDFEIALLAYRIPEHRDRVLWIASTDLEHDAWRSAGGRIPGIVGDAEVFGVASTHTDLHAPANVEFGAAMQGCMSRLYEWSAHASRP